MAQGLSDELKAFRSDKAFEMVQAAVFAKVDVRQLELLAERNTERDVSEELSVKRRVLAETNAAAKKMCDFAGEERAKFSGRVRDKLNERMPNMRQQIQKAEDIVENFDIYKPALSCQQHSRAHPDCPACTAEQDKKVWERRAAENKALVDAMEEWIGSVSGSGVETSIADVVGIDRKYPRTTPEASDDEEDGDSSNDVEYRRLSNPVAETAKAD